MNTPAFLEFTPVPLRSRYDGWGPDVQRSFVLALARGMRPGEAAELVGMSRASAYKLRTRPGAEGFAAACDAALRFARGVRAGAARARARPPAAAAAGPARRHDERATALLRARAAAARPQGSSDELRRAFERLVDAAVASTREDGKSAKGIEGDKGDRQ